MARARNIKPGLFKNEVLGVADPLCTLLFEGLWLLADREGRLEDRPLRIKAEIFPYRDIADFGALLDWLVVNGFIVRYKYGENRYIQIVNFQKHQNPHKNEAESAIPCYSDIYGSTEKIGTSTEKIGATPADSLLLIPDSLNTDSEGEASPTPPAKMPEQIKLVKKIAKIVPNKAVWDEVVEALGEQPDEDKLRLCFKTWVTKGFKVRNLAWISDWYVKGIPSYQMNGRPKPPDPGTIQPTIDIHCDTCGDVGTITRFKPGSSNLADATRIACPKCNQAQVAA